MSENISRDERENRGERASVRRQDLATRERVNFIVDSDVMNQLRSTAKEKKRPMSRIIDEALVAYLETGKNNVQTSLTNENGEIILEHLLEIVVYAPVESETCISFLTDLKTYFSNYIYSSCLLNLHIPTDTMIVTKIVLFLSDQDNECFSNFVKYLSCAREGLKIDVRLDKRNI